MCSCSRNKNISKNSSTIVVIVIYYTLCSVSPVSLIGGSAYENPTPTGCSKNTILAYFVHEKGFRKSVLLAPARQGPNSVYKPSRPEQPI